MGREVNRKKQRETERVIGLNRETLSERSAIESIRSHGSEKEKVGLVVREWFLLGNHP